MKHYGMISTPEGQKQISDVYRLRDNQYFYVVTGGGSECEIWQVTKEKFYAAEVGLDI